MRIAVARETDANEPRVAATPETVKKFKALGADIVVARGAGHRLRHCSMPTSKRPARRSPTIRRRTPTSC